MDEVYLFPRNDYRSYLEHHGIPGQKWGVRKAAWYPISAFQKASNKVGTKVHEFREKRAAERKRKQKAANLQKAREARAKKAQETKDFEAEKKRILTSGTPGEVVKISSKLSNQEIQDALNRNRNLEQLRAAESTRVKDIKDAEFAAKYEKLDKIAKTVNKGIEYANTAKNAIDVYKGIKKLLKDDGPETSDIDAILRNPKNYTDEQVKNAAMRKRNLDSMQPKVEPQKEAPKKSASLQDILDNPGKYSDSDIADAVNRQSTINRAWEELGKSGKSSPVENFDSGKSTKSSSKKTTDWSDVVDADYVDLSKNINSENVSTALTVLSNAMNEYDRRRGN